MASEPTDQSSQKHAHLPLYHSRPHKCSLRGKALLATPEFNKGSAFTQSERETFDLDGLLPTNVQTLEEQAARAYDQYKSRSDALAKNTFMTSMLEQNEVLYFRLVADHIKEMMSVIYTPTEGDAIQNYSRLFRRSSGCFLDIDHSAQAEQIERALRQQGRSAEDVDYIVVTDGEEILGIGDQGVGGVLISVAKLVLTTACAGIHPGRTVPVVLDCGTDNAELLNDELYLGLKRPRVRGERYDAFVDAFIQTARRVFPRAYIHFEDFGLPNARRILDKYRPQMACFNDDVQGTGCVTLAAIYAALQVADLKLADVRVVIFGAGTAGTGIADMIRDAIATETGKGKDEACKQIWCVDKPGLLLQSMGVQDSSSDSSSSGDGGLTHAQRPYARSDSDWPHPGSTSLLDVIRTVHPHILIGTSTRPKTFTETIVREMASHVARPIIFPLSNPTRLHEADPHDILAWTAGKALVSTGSPFPPYKVPDSDRTIEVAECNNSTCFPGIGLGAVLSRAQRVSDRMLVMATKALAGQSPALKVGGNGAGKEGEVKKGEQGDRGLLPDVADAREVSVHIAVAVVKAAVEEGLAREEGIPEAEEELEEWVRAQMWRPEYRELVPV